MLEYRDYLQHPAPLGWPLIRMTTGTTAFTRYLMLPAGYVVLDSWFMHVLYPGSVA